MAFIPSGEERDVRRVKRVAVDGAPLSYIVTLAAVATALAIVPLSVVVGSGKSFPLSQGVYPLVGWLLGPVAGALANGVGALIGVFVAPHTTTLPLATVLGAAVGGLAAGVMRGSGKRRWWWQPLALFFAALYGIYAGQALIRNGVAWYAVLLGSLIDWSALLLFVMPTRVWFAQWMLSTDPKSVALGLFCGTWTIAGLTHLTASSVIYIFSNWPNEVWLAMAPLAPLEHVIRAAVGAIIGVGVILGLRATGLVKPEHANF